MGLFDIWRDLRFGFRRIWNSPGYSASVIVTLALGTGCSVALFALVDGAIMRHPSVLRLDQLANVWRVNWETGSDRGSLSLSDFKRINDRSRSFTEMAAFVEDGSTVNYHDGARTISTQYTSASYFRILGASPRFGRVFGQRDEEVGAPLVAIVGEDLWRTEFGGRSDLEDQKIVIDGRSFLVIGVMPSGFWYPSPGPELWLPISAAPSTSVEVFGRLNEGVTEAQASEELLSLLRGSSTKSGAWSHGVGIRVVTYTHENSKRGGMGLMLLLGPPILMLVIGCANVSNLLIARSVSRQADI